MKQSSHLTKLYHERKGSTNIQILGASAARNIYSIEGEGIYCQSSLACADTITHITSNDTIACRGLGSCYNTTMATGSADPDTHWARCQATAACANSIIKTSSYVLASGAYSLMGSTVYSWRDDINNGPSNYALYFNFDGWFSGFNATIICDDSMASCFVRCYNIHACNYTRIICNNGAFCSTTCTNNADCPEIEYNVTIDDTITAVTDTRTANIADFDPYYVDTISLIKEEDNRCDNEAGSIKFDEYSINYGNNVSILDGKNNSNSNICCRAFVACERFGGNIYCLGFRSCSFATLSNARNIYCDAGFEGCSDTIITRSKNIFVTGYGDVISNTTIIGNNVDANKMNVYILSNLESYHSSVIICCNKNDICTIVCGTYYSCQDSIGSAVRVYCNNGNCEFACSPADGISCPERRNGSCPGVPTAFPTTMPTNIPSTVPSSLPSDVPSSFPTGNPINTPSSHPTSVPTSRPTNPPTGRLVASTAPSTTIPTEFVSFKTDSLFIEASKISYDINYNKYCGGNTVIVSGEYVFAASLNGTVNMDCILMITDYNLYLLSRESIYEYNNYASYSDPFKANFVLLDITREILVRDYNKTAINTDSITLSKSDPRIISFQTQNISFFDRNLLNHFPLCLFYNESLETFDNKNCFVLNYNSTTILSYFLCI